MSNRTQRREAERLARKLSEAQLTANRANAQLSTGPVTPVGRETSSRNALKTGLTGQTVLLPTDDTAEYNRRLENAIAFHAPATEEEQTLVQSLVDIDWRLARIVTLESAIYLKGTIEFSETHKDQPESHRKALIQAETYLKYEKPLRNLNIQEARLQRQRTKTLAQLKDLQNRPQPAPPKGEAKAQGATPNGFEFSTHFNAPAAAEPNTPSSPNTPPL